MRSKLLKIRNSPPRLQVLRGALQGAACPAGPTFQSKDEDVKKDKIIHVQQPLRKRVFCVFTL